MRPLGKKILPAGEHKGIGSPTLQEPPPERLRLSREGGSYGDGAMIWIRAVLRSSSATEGGSGHVAIHRVCVALDGSAVCISQGHHTAETIKVIVVDRAAVSQVYHTDRLVNARAVYV